jgi:hypothetical protein
MPRVESPRAPLEVGVNTGTMLSTALRFSLALSLAAAAACGGSAPPATSPAAPTDSSAAAAPTASATSAGTSAAAAPPSASGSDSSVPATWTNDMTKPQQVAFMKAKVMPAMGPVFKAHDATKYADFGCKTCHGQGQNPHDFLPHLTFTGGTITSFKDKPEMSKWMHEVVVPAMAGAFGQQPYDMKTNTGFGCPGCHTVDQK